MQRIGRAAAGVQLTAATAAALFVWLQNQHDQSLFPRVRAYYQPLPPQTKTTTGTALPHQPQRISSSRNNNNVLQCERLLRTPNQEASSSKDGHDGASRTGETDADKYFRLSSSRRSSSKDGHDGASRTGETDADKYFRLHGKLPRPKVMHAVLPNNNNNNNNNDCSSGDDDDDKRGILVIGDVHGCYDELLLLHEKAVVEYNEGRAFCHVILVGDLSNKGPQSVPVLRHVRRTPHWWSVRGNHDDGALRAALGDAAQQSKSKYQWIFNDGLSDADVDFLAELPYTIRIPKEMLNNNDEEERFDTLIVHAGLIPGLNLEEQSIETMITVREVVEEVDGSYRYYRKDDSHNNNNNAKPNPWASVWTGPEKVFFGHDARRGLQQYAWAVGLDTGVCYGKKLTGVVLLPNHLPQLVQVEALDVHCPIGGGGGGGKSRPRVNNL